MQKWQKKKITWTTQNYILDTTINSSSQSCLLSCSTYFVIVFIAIIILIWHTFSLVGNLQIQLLIDLLLELGTGISLLFTAGRVA